VEAPVGHTKTNLHAALGAKSANCLVAGCYGEWPWTLSTSTHSFCKYAEQCHAQLHFLTDTALKIFCCHTSSQCAEHSKSIACWCHRTFHVSSWIDSTATTCDQLLYHCVNHTWRWLLQNVYSDV